MIISKMIQEKDMIEPLKTLLFYLINGINL